MSISVRLDAEIEGQLRRIARQRGVSKSEVIREAIKLLANGESEKKSFRPRFYDIPARKNRPLLDSSLVDLRQNNTHALLPQPRLSSSALHRLSS